jgi:hypothetical protein
LRARNLTEEDLSSEARSAIERDAPVEEIIALIRATTIDAELVTRRLARARASFERSAAKLPKEELEELDGVYLDLRSAIHPKLSAPPEQLLARIARFEARIRKL